MTARSNRKKTTPKTISATGITGQRGINAIERIVLESGSRWTPSGPNEIGIDGYIELFDSATRRPLGLTLAVQSKVVSAIATNDAPSFDYSCDPKDVAYWLQGNIPVVLIVSSGDPSHTYWAPVREHFKMWKPGDSTRVTFLKAEHKLDQHTFPQLASIAAPRAGSYLPPPHKPETLYTNLLPLELCPPSISIAGSPCRSVHEVWTALRAEGGDVDGGWILWEKKILSFHDLAKPPWSAVCDLGTLEEFSTEEWSETDDPQRQRIFVQLLNRTLRAQLYPDVRYWPQEDCYAIQGQPHIARRENLSRTTLGHIKHFLSGAFRYARRQGVLENANPIRDVEIPKARPAGETYAYSLEEEAQMLAILPEPTATVVATAAFTGARKGEIRGFTWQNYDGSEIRVEKSVWRSHVDEPKRPKSKGAIPVIAQLKLLLDQHWETCGRPRKEFIFANELGNPMNLEALAVDVIRPALQKANLAWHGWHAFRRGLATNLHRLGVSDKVIQQILRHANVSTTMNIYVKTVSADAANAMKSLETMCATTVQPERLGSTRIM